MGTLYLWLVFAQVSEPVAVPKGVIEHDGLEDIERQMPADVFDEEHRLHGFVAEKKYEEVASELLRRYKQTEMKRPVQMTTMGYLLGSVASARIKQPISKDAVDGRTDPKFRAICRPYVDAIVLPELSIPAAPEALKAQIKLVVLFQSNTEESDRARVGEREELRREYVRRLCLVWSRLVATSMHYRDTFTEDILKGRACYPRPEPPQFLFEFANGRTDPKRISDPAKRKTYEEYLAADGLAMDQYRAAMLMSACRTSHLINIRRSLETVYGEDRSQWNELRQIANETIKLPDVAQLVIKDFTRRKEPGLWP